MCLADCDVVWGKLSQGAGFCSPRQLRDVAQLPGLSSASVRAGLGRSRSLPGDCQAATSSSGLEHASWRWEKRWNVDTSVSRVSLCACAALGQQPLGTITPLNVLLYFLHSRYLLLLSWRTKWGNKTNCRTKIVWPAHKGKVAASHGWKNYSIKTAVRDGQFRTFGAVELRRKLMSERVCRSLSLH